MQHSPGLPVNTNLEKLCFVHTYQNKKFELMLTRRAKADSRFGSR